MKLFLSHTKNNNIKNLQTTRQALDYLDIDYPLVRSYKTYYILELRNFSKELKYRTKDTTTTIKIWLYCKCNCNSHESMALLKIYQTYL